ncbi:MAG TPA: hypothetical protein PKE29_18255 [Phycisphaerales bacterium]|nr:hypothetical protein [Phycisphaerales bacterium]
MAKEAAASAGLLDSAASWSARAASAMGLEARLMALICSRGTALSLSAMRPRDLAMVERLNAVSSASARLPVVMPLSMAVTPSVRAARAAA